MAELLSFDFGNGRGKWFNAVTDTVGDFRHAIARLSESTWRQVTSRNGAIPAGYVRVNGKPYAVGDVARRYTIADKPNGAARYVEDYYGVALGFALSQAYPHGARGAINLLLTHAPADLDYAEDLCVVAERPSAKRLQRKTWEVESVSGKHVYVIGEVKTLDEPLGGYFQFALTFDGQFKDDAMIEYGEGKNKRAVHISQITLQVIDAGSFTTDVGIIDANGAIDNASFRSTRIGGQNVLESFEKALRSNNSKLFKGVGDLDVKRVESALLSGVYRFGAKDVPCQQEATECLSELTNDVLQVVESAGGVANFDALLLTGGWAKIIYPSLVARLENAKIVTADKFDRMMHANARGGAKYVALMATPDELMAEIEKRGK